MIIGRKINDSNKRNRSGCSMIMAEINYLWKCVSHYYYLRLIKKKKRDKRRECIVVEDLEKKQKNACDERGLEEWVLIGEYVWMK